MVDLKDIPTSEKKIWIPWPEAHTDCLEWTLLQNGIADFEILHHGDPKLKEIRRNFPKRIPDCYPEEGTTDYIAAFRSHLDWKELMKRTAQMVHDKDWFRYFMEASEKEEEEFQKWFNRTPFPECPGLQERLGINTQNGGRTQ